MKKLDTAWLIVCFSVLFACLSSVSAQNSPEAINTQIRTLEAEKADINKQTDSLKLLDEKLQSGKFILCLRIGYSEGEYLQMYLPMRRESCDEYINSELADGRLTNAQVTEFQRTALSSTQNARGEIAAIISENRNRLNRIDSQLNFLAVERNRISSPNTNNQTVVVTAVGGNNNCEHGDIWEVTEFKDAQTQQFIWEKSDEGNKYELYSGDGEVLSRIYITVTGKSVSVFRTIKANNGTAGCRYTGEFGPDGKTVSGTFTCSNDAPSRTYKWQAVIYCP